MLTYKYGLIYVLLVTGLFSVAPAVAQPSRSTPAAHPRTPGPIVLTLDGWIRGESRSHADYRNDDSNDPDSEFSRLRLGLRWNLPRSTGGNLAVRSLFVQPQATFRHVAHASPSTINTTGERLELHQGYVEGGLLPAVAWRLGEQELVYGDFRLLGPGNWNYPGRSWDAAKLSAALGRTKVDIFGSRLAQGPNKVNAPFLHGVYAVHSLAPSASTDVYVLYKGDRVTGSGIDVWTLGLRPRITIGRNAEVTLEGARQTGRSSGKQIAAGAFAAVANYTLSAPTSPRLGLEYDYASGGNPADARHTGTFDNLFPTNHSHYGIADVQGWRNMHDFVIRLSCKPGGKATLLGEAHRFRLANAKDFWYGDNGSANKGIGGKLLRDATGASGTEVGREFDLSLTLPIQNHVTLLLGGARFVPGSFVRSANGGAAHSSNWGFVQMALNY